MAWLLALREEQEQGRMEEECEMVRTSRSVTRRIMF